MTLSCLHPHSDGCLLAIYVQPRSSRNQIVGLHQGALKIKLTSPPVDGAANKTCREYLAKLFKRPKSEVAIVAGEASRHKRVVLQGIDMADARRVLREAMPS